MVSSEPVGFVPRLCCDSVLSKVLLFRSGFGRNWVSNLGQLLRPSPDAVCDQFTESSPWFFCNPGGRGDIWKGANLVLYRITEELRTLALPWFEDFRRKANEDQILQFGLRWLEAHQEEIPFDIASQIETALVVSRFRRDRVQLSLLAKLKADLRAHATHIGASKWQRRETSVLALDLLTYAGHEFARKGRA